MRKLNSLLVALFAVAVMFTGCDSFDLPTVVAPAITTVANGATAQSVTFNVTVDADLTATYAATGTGVTVTNATGTVNGTSVTINFDAGTTAGAAAIVLTITDTEGQMASGTAVITVGAAVTVVTVNSNITTNTTWTADKTYILGGRVAVESGATLTIEAGTVIKGQAGTGANATALLIARGAKLMAQGTATLPIVFTSVADEITHADIAAGNMASPNLDPTVSGLWGGLIILGNAPISGDAASIQIEGIPASDQNGLYGGSDAADNSGVITYISIRHGGANIGEGNEINGLTLGGVGSGTVINYVEVIGNQDDGIEWFGGTVNVNHAIVWNAGDDAMDTDQAWAGTLDNFGIVCGTSTDHALEIDGPEGTLLAGHTLKNGTAKGETDSELGDFRSSARGSFQNIFFFNFPDPATAGRGDLSLSSGSDVTFTNGDLTFSGLQAVLPAGVALTAVFKNGTSAHATAVAQGAQTVGCDKTKFANWTWTEEAGELTDF